MPKARYGSATLWALCAVLGYAAQHPFEKPLVSKIQNSWGGYAEIALATEIVMLVALAIGLSQSVVRKIFREMISPKNLWNTVGLSAIGTASSIIYVSALARSNPIYLSLILNMVPLYFYLVQAIMRRSFPPASAIIAISIGVAGLVISEIIEKHGTFNIYEFVQEFSLFSVVPVLFATRSILSYDLYGDKDELSRVLVLAAFDAPLVFLVVIVGLLFFHQSVVLPTHVHSLDGVLFVIGIISASILGQTALQKANRAAGRNALWYPGLFFFLVPFSVMLFGVILKWTVGDEHTKFNWGYVVGAIFLCVALISETYYKNRGRFNEMWKVVLGRMGRVG